MSEGTWTQWAKYVIETLKSLTDSLKELEGRCNEFMEKDDHTAACANIQTTVKTMQSKLDEATKTIILTKEQLKGHTERHDYKWKIISGISGILASLLALQKLLELIK